MNYSATQPASILFLGMGWFPKIPGGLNRYLYELALKLSEHDVVEFCGIDLPPTSLSSKVLLTNLASRQNHIAQRLWLVRQQFKRRQLSQPDAINLHFALYSLPILDVLPREVPVTFNFHGPWALESQEEGAKSINVQIKQRVEQKVYGRCDRFIVLSKSFGSILHKTYDIPWSKIHVIPGGVDTQRFRSSLSRQSARTRLGWPPDRAILFTSRRLVKRMGLDKLLTSLAQVKQRVPDVWLAIAGKGGLRPELERQTQELELQNHVRFLGFLAEEDLPLAYQAADITVVPSQSLEGFGLILLESLACGTPVICTPVGGMPEVITPFFPELITQSVEAKEIAASLIEFLQGRTSLPSRTACSDYARLQFDWEVIAPRVRDVLLMKT